MKKFGVFLYKICDRLGLAKIIFPLPLELMIEPSNVCNARCPTCPTGAGKMNRPGRMMTFQEFRRIVDQAGAYGGALFLWGYGEPFLNKDLLLMIQHASSGGMHVVTSTNGQFFKSLEFCSEIVRSGLDELIISLDGADQQTLSKFRVDCQFDDIVQGFRFMHAARTELNSMTPKIILQFIVTRHNVHQIERIKQIAKDLHVDTYFEKTVWMDANDPGFQSMAKELVPDDPARSRFFAAEDGHFSLKGEVRNHCAQVSRRIVVNSDGSVVPCCYDLYSKYIMGNVFNESVEAVWNNEQYRAFRQQVSRDKKSLTMCRECPSGRGSADKVW